MTDTKIPAAIRVDWWYGERVLEGEEELPAELAENCAVSIVHTRRGGLGGGLYNFSSNSSCSSLYKKWQGFSWRAWWPST